MRSVLALALGARALTSPVGAAPPEPDGHVPAKVVAPAPEFPPRAEGSAFAECHDCPEMVVVPPGSFIMGSSEEERHTLGVLAMFDTMEEPRHRVTIGYRYAISRYEVTFAQWDACLADGGCNGYRPDDAGWGRGRRPVINVNFADVQSYLKWLSAKTGASYRLLSEAEWAYAARGGTQTWYPFGNALSADKANAAQVLDRTTPVGNYAPNGFGLHDVIGNVAEWTQDCHHDSYEGAPADGSAWLTGPCELRNVRGGGWSLQGWSVRAAQRIGDPPGARNDHLGFRVAREMPQD
ncbi:formylglycine-generating enzyme family protein [Novosphingobium sp. BW1]|uniref:formylglycine-generating enzyme family protein n=1 Tax=Novosphingobium sp. BW1 TaxID=2592621 RepID=UPI0011DE9351|nr:formylglycine-generating enzyme family protein [Novosphingobium sp. BW1]TYC90892.1 formylglycine-generating enzyme family protein [Novosphingobium sp. BW1]